MVNNPGNWMIDTTNGAYTTTIPDTTAFTVTAVPEPESIALVLPGLGIVGLRARRNATR